MDRNHNEAIMKTIGMSANKDAQDLAAGHNLRVLAEGRTRLIVSF